MREFTRVQMSRSKILYCNQRCIFIFFFHFNCDSHNKLFNCAGHLEFGGHFCSFWWHNNVTNSLQVLCVFTIFYTFTALQCVLQSLTQSLYTEKILYVNTMRLKQNIMIWVVVICDHVSFRIQFTSKCYLLSPSGNDASIFFLYLTL